MLCRKQEAMQEDTGMSYSCWYIISWHISKTMNSICPIMGAPGFRGSLPHTRSTWLQRQSSPHWEHLATEAVLPHCVPVSSGANVSSVSLAHSQQAHSTQYLVFTFILSRRHLLNFNKSLSDRIWNFTDEVINLNTQTVDMGRVILIIMRHIWY